jgi:CheY-like chemotaxis protein
MQQRTDRAKNLLEEVQKGSVLVVDDDEFSRDLLSRRMQRAGYHVTATADGREVPDLLDKHDVDLVLLDLVMPLASGHEVLASIRANRSPSQLPVIMVTSKIDGDDIAECFRRGANDYQYPYRCVGGNH